MNKFYIIPIILTLLLLPLSTQPAAAQSDTNPGTPDVLSQLQQMITKIITQVTKNIEDIRNLQVQHVEDRRSIDSLYDRVYYIEESISVNEDQRFIDDLYERVYALEGMIVTPEPEPTIPLPTTNSTS